MKMSRDREDLSQKVLRQMNSYVSICLYVFNSLDKLYLYVLCQNVRLFSAKCENLEALQLVLI